MRLAPWLLLLASCTEQRCYYPPARDAFMTRCLEHLAYNDCEYNADVQGWKLICVDVVPVTKPQTTSHYSTQ